MQDRGSHRQLLISIGLVVLVILLLLALVDVGAVIDMLLLADWRMLLLAIAFLVLSYLIITLRTRYLLANRAGFLDALKVDGSGLMLSILVQAPNSAYRVVAMDRTTPAKASETTSVIVAEYVFSFILRLVALVLGFAFLAGAAQGQTGSLIAAACALALLLAGLFLLASRNETLEPKLARALQHLPRVEEATAERISSTLFGVVSRVGSPRRFGVALLFSLAYWLCALAFFFFVLQAFDLDESISYPLVALVTVLFVPPSAPLMAGVFHGVLVTPLVALNLMDAEVATAYAILVHAIEMVILIFLGSWGLSRMKIRPGELLAEVRGRMRAGKADANAESEA